MAFTPTTWVDGTTAITATQLNRIETGIDDAHAGSIDDAALTTTKLAAVTFAAFASQAITTTAWVVPAGMHWMVFTAINGIAEIQVSVDSVWQPIVDAVNTAVLVVSDGTNVRVLAVGATPTATLKYRTITHG